MANGHKRPPIAIPIALLLLMAAAVGYWWWTTQGTGSREAQMLSGTVESREYQVASAMAGRIVELGVVEGDHVEKGDTIARLDDAALKLQLEQARQGVRAAKAQVSQVKKDGSKAEVRAAKARQAQAEAAVELAEVQLAYATIYAPNAGMIVSVPANAGENAGPGKALATIADPSDLFVRVFVPEPSLGDVKIGAPARVIATGGDFDGTVTFVSASAEFTPNTVETREERGNLVFEVRVAVADPTGVLKAGLPVDVDFGVAD